MDRFVAAVRRLFGKKENEGANHSHNKEEENREPNEVQKVERKQHPYDEVTLDDDGPAVDPATPNEFQAPKRAPRSYEEVELPKDGKVEVR